MRPSSSASPVLEPPTERVPPAVSPAPRRIWSERFQRFAKLTSDRMGSHWTFAAALFLVVVWLVTGPLFRFSETWQLVINTFTTIVTFLMIFLVQATQNRESRALQLKIDELIRTSRARNVFAGLEHAGDDELRAFEVEFEQLRQKGLSAGLAATEAHRRVHRPHATPTGSRSLAVAQPTDR